MLKINSTENQTSITAAGGMSQVLAELGNAIGSLYAQIAAQNMDVAKEFRRMLTHMLVDPDSGVWTIEAQSSRCAMIRNSKQGFSAEDIGAAIKNGASIDVIKELLREDNR